MSQFFSHRYSSTMNQVPDFKLSFSSILIFLSVLFNVTLAWQTSRVGVCAEYVKDENQTVTKDVYKFCCEGYREVNSTDDKIKCTAMCSKTCVLSTCIKPETCGCWDRHKPLSKYQCTPECSSTCINGFCSAPDTCTCSPGFNKNPVDSSVCLPELGYNDNSHLTISLNNHSYSSILEYKGNSTYKFTSFPELYVKRSCSSLFFGNSNETALNWTEMFCGLLEISDESHPVLYCHWSNRFDVNDSYTEFPSDLELDINSTSTQYDIKFLIQFSEQFGTNSDNASCNICISLPDQSRYMSVKEDISFMVRPCHRHSWSMMNWAVLLGAALVSLFVVSTAVILLFLSFPIVRSRKSALRPKSTEEYH